MRYYLRKGKGYGTLDRNSMMRQFQDGMNMDAAQSALPIGITDLMLASTGLADWDTGASCARVAAPELTGRSALVLVVDRFPSKYGGQNESKIDMTWDLASLFVDAIRPSSRCWDGMNVADTKSGRPCIEVQFVGCTFTDGAGGIVPLTAGFMYPTQRLRGSADKWNLRFQLNYKKAPVRAVQVTSSDGQTTVDAQYGYGQWQVNHISGAPFRIGVSYGGKDAQGHEIYHRSQPVQPPDNVTRKDSWPQDAWRYQQSDFSHVVDVALDMTPSRHSP
jgi:hypothetical protein